MKFYEKLSPTDRKIMILKTVALDNALEGMLNANEACLKKIQTLQNTRAKKIINSDTSKEKHPV